MKTKPILIALACVAVIVCLFFVVKAKYFKAGGKENTSGVAAFLSAFNAQLKKGNTDSALTYFSMGNKGKLHSLVESLDGVTTMMGIKVSLNTEASKITFSTGGAAIATVPVTLSRDSMADKKTSITFTILKLGGEYKITDLQPNAYLGDYKAYINLIRSKTISEKDIYSPITLASFKVAEQLKARYDSVLWFTHINGQTYYYVVKGKWDMNDLEKDSTKEYKMGLLAPDLKEIIPPEYDLVHNIGGTFAGLIEVDKDNKHGFYDLSGKVVLPIEYDDIFAVKGDNPAALRKGDDYYWLKPDYTVSGKVDMKISGILSNLKQGGSATFKNDTTDNITEFNSREVHSTLRIPPSYLVSLGIFPALQPFTNPLRKNVYFEDASSQYVVKLDNKSGSDDGWLSTVFYKIRDYFLGGRGEFYDRKKLIITDKQKNKVYSYDLLTDESSEMDEDETVQCDEYSIKALSDTMFEIKASTILNMQLYDGTNLHVAPVFHYLNRKSSKLTDLPTNRIFSFTKFVNMDEAYLSGCYIYKRNISDDSKPTPGKRSSTASIEVLKYMKNEIYADYHYRFKDTTWTNLFNERMNRYKPENASVDDSLTAIDKYNIAWINQKLNQASRKRLASR